MENPGEADLHATDLDAVIWWGEVPPSMTESLAARDGAIVPVYSDRNLTQLLFHEQVVSIDTTASGGNAELLAASC